MTWQTSAGILSGRALGPRLCGGLLLFMKAAGVMIYDSELSGNHIAEVETFLVVNRSLGKLSLRRAR